MGFAPPGVKVPDLRLDRDGRWYIDGEEILHARSVMVLTENVQLLQDGTFVTSIGRETVPIRIDDVAFFVCDCTLLDAGLGLVLSDRSEETIAEPVLRSGAEGRVYVQIKGGRTWARFSRGTHQWLQELWQERGGVIGLVVRGRFVPVAM
jgi:hypothetical protein